MRIWLQRFTLFVGIVVVVQILIVHFSHRGTFAEYEQLKTALEKNTSVIYFGDSTLRRSAPDDKDKRSIADFLQERVPLSVKSIDHEAYNLAMYRALSSVISESPRKPTFVIVPLNLRTFSPTMYEVPDTRFKTEQAFLEWGVPGWLYRPFKTFYQPLAPSSLSLIQKDDDLTLDGASLGPLGYYLKPPPLTPTKEQEMQRIAVNYLLPIQPTHEYLRAARELTETLLAHHITPLYYFTPLDVERMKTSFPNVITKIATKKALLMDAIKRPGVIILDLTEDLPSDGFIQDPYASEHLNQKGRIFVATQLADELLAHAGSPKE